jgi:hypothetical protein
VFSEGAYFRSEGENDTSARVGSVAFLGPNGEEPEFLRTVREHRPGEVVDGIRVVERFPLEAAERRGIFAVPVEKAAWVSRELEPGAAPTVAVAAYWFGPTLAGREAFVASEIGSPDETVHITCYGDPAEVAAGKTHCLPDANELPRRELQIVSRPLTDDLVQREVTQLERSGTGRPIRLANGEEAVLYRRAVLTETTLVTVAGGGVDLAAHVEKLRPL